MLPGKTYKPEDILSILWRRRWVVLVPFVVASAATVLVSRTLPDLYRAETLILVVPQRVPESYVKSTVTTKVEDRLQSINQQIMSRTRLEKVIVDFGLYQAERRLMPMEDVVERMRGNIIVQPLKGDASFSVRFVSENPQTAAKVANRLAEIFMDESRVDRASQAQATTDFLENQLADARRRLIEHENKLRDYQTRHSGELPSERQANLEALNNFQLQVQNLIDSTNRDLDRKVLIQKSITELEADGRSRAPAPSAPSADPSGVPTGSAAEALDAARRQLQALQLRLTPQHPDVIRMRAMVRDLEAKAQAEALERPLTPSSEPAKPLTFEEVTRRTRLKNAQLELDALERQIESKKLEEGRLRRDISTYQARLAAAPLREADLIELSRDYDTLKKSYNDLLSKQEESKVSADLENRQIGQQFKTLDQARVPERPFSPNRLMINAGGALGGLALGLLVVALMEYRNSSFRIEEDVVRVLALPVLATIPNMLTRAERHRAKKRRRLTAAAAAGVAVAAAGLAMAWKFGSLTWLGR